MNTELQIIELEKILLDLQKVYWECDLYPIYGTGCIKSPEVCFVFMNPTVRNLGTHPEWSGLRAPWLWISPVWKIFYELWFLSKDVFQLTQKKSSWSEEFVEKLYCELNNHKIYLTNLCKASQKDAKPLKNSVFQTYLESFYKEIEILQAKKIICFWWQVSSIVLKKKIEISLERKKVYSLELWDNNFKIYPVYYPVWLWMRNMWKAIEDIKYILEN